MEGRTLNSLTSLARETISVRRQLPASEPGTDRAPSTKEQQADGIDSETPETRLVVLNSPLEVRGALLSFCPRLRGFPGR